MQTFRSTGVTDSRFCRGSYCDLPSSQLFRVQLKKLHTWTWLTWWPLQLLISIRRRREDKRGIILPFSECVMRLIGMKTAAFSNDSICFIWVNSNSIGSKQLFKKTKSKHSSTSNNDTSRAECKVQGSEDVLCFKWFNFHILIAAIRLLLCFWVT